MQKMTEGEFWQHYAHNSLMGVEELRAMGCEARPCDCGEPPCRGWRMDTTAIVDEEILRRLQQATRNWRMRN